MIKSTGVWYVCVCVVCMCVWCRLFLGSYFHSFVKFPPNSWSNTKVVWIFYHVPWSSLNHTHTLKPLDIATVDKFKLKHVTVNWNGVKRRETATLQPDPTQPQDVWTLPFFAHFPLSFWNTCLMNFHLLGISFSSIIFVSIVHRIWDRFWCHFWCLFDTFPVLTCNLLNHQKHLFS